MQRSRASWAVVAILSGSSTALAQEEPGDLQVHGFVSQGYIKTTKHNYLGQTERAQGSFDFTEVGRQLRAAARLVLPGLPGFRWLGGSKSLCSSRSA